jgi:RimJ/RimL family protein N-acetyltransferase
MLLDPISDPTRTKEERGLRAGRFPRFNGVAKFRGSLNIAKLIRYIDVPWTDAKSHRTFLHQRIIRSYPDGLGYWSVVLKSIPAAFIGRVLLLPYDPTGPDDASGPEAEIGWRFLRSAWGNGYGSQAGQSGGSRPHRCRHPSPRDPSGLQESLACVWSENAKSRANCCDPMPWIASNMQVGTTETKRHNRCSKMRARDVENTYGRSLA